MAGESAGSDGEPTEIGLPWSRFLAFEIMVGVLPVLTVGGTLAVAYLARSRWESTGAAGITGVLGGSASCAIWRYGHRVSTWLCADVVRLLDRELASRVRFLSPVVGAYIVGGVRGHYVRWALDPLTWKLHAAFQAVLTGALVAVALVARR